MAHASNLSYSGGRDQEDWSSKPDWANSLWDSISKIPNTAGHWCLTPVILATQEAEIRKLTQSTQHTEKYLYKKSYWTLARTSGSVVF
jgi:hypothetical protein